MCSKVKLCLLLVFLTVGSFESVNGATRGWWRNAWNFLRPTTCVHKGKTYKKGDIFDKSYDSKTNTCYYHECGSNRQVYKLSTPNCKVITSPTPTQTTPTTKKTRCVHNGKRYDLGTTIETGQIGNWCWITICGQDGQIISGDNFNCGPKSSTTTREPSTTPPFTTPFGPPGCTVNGNHYALGESISSGQTGNWCYGQICGENGHIIAWDNFKCGSSTMTTAPSTPPGK